MDASKTDDMRDEITSERDENKQNIQAKVDQDFTEARTV